MTLSPSRVLAGLVLAALFAITAVAADVRLYPSGPPNGVAYLRFANMARQPVLVVSPAARITLPVDDAHRVGEFDGVNPGSKLTGSVQLGEESKPIDLTLAANEFASVVITESGNGGLAVAAFRETPTDFNAAKSSIALYNADSGCADGQLVAGDNHLSVISNVAPGASGRRAVNPVNAELTVSCGDPGQSVPARLGPLAAGDRYSVFVFAVPGAGRQVVAVRDEQAAFHP